MEIKMDETEDSFQIIFIKKVNHQKNLENPLATDDSSVFLFPLGLNALWSQALGLPGIPRWRRRPELPPSLPGPGESAVMEKHYLVPYFPTWNLTSHKKKGL